jgi:hypothetical protein
MGKQSKKKGRWSGKKKRNSNNSSSASTIINDESSASGHTSLVQKLRHGDVRVRHGVLAAIASTLFDPSLLSSRQTKKSQSGKKNENGTITMELIQVIAQRIMDDDIPSATCAVGCLGNYILFGRADALDGNDEELNRIETTLTPILLSRMTKTGTILPSLAQQATEKLASNASANVNPLVLKSMEEWSLLSQCLEALCSLVEQSASNTSSSSLLYHQRDDFLSTILSTWTLSVHALTTLHSTMANLNKTTAPNTFWTSMASLEDQRNSISNVMVYASRTLHAACDDNPTLVSKLLQPPSNSTLQEIGAALDNNVLPPLGRLHCSGLTFICGQLAPPPNANAELMKLIETKILPLLMESTNYRVDIAKALQNQIHIYETQMKSERTDEALEKSAIRASEQRKEKAKDIAKRQKPIRAEKKAEKKKAREEARNANSNAVQMDDDDDDDDKKDGEEKEEEENVQDPYEEIRDKHNKAVTSWKRACLPLKLSIEIIANMCVPSSEPNFEDEGSAGIFEKPMILSKEDEALLNMIVSKGVPDHVLKIFECILVSLGGTDNSKVTPAVVDEDLSEIVSKCGICLGNMVCNLTTWKIDEVASASVWKGLCECLASIQSNPPMQEHGGEKQRQEVDWLVYTSTMGAVLTVMVAFLRFRPSLVKSVDENILNSMLSQAIIETPIALRTSESTNAKTANLTILDSQRDAIAILSILCSEPHQDVINMKICDALLTILQRSNSSSVGIMSEVLNALMRMYSADADEPDNHEDVFRNKNVLGAFQKSVPIMKRKIREEEGRSNHDDVEIWNETIFNATRFIKYKQY